MTEPAAWCTRLGAALADAADRAGTLAGHVAADWPDAHGQHRADRLTLLHRALARAADDAVALGARVDSATDVGATDPMGVPPHLPALGRAPSGRRTGARLGAVDAERADDDTGMRLPGTDGDR